jgi:homoserine O-acetyltransferase
MDLEHASDANDFIHQWSASFSYAPEPELGRTEAAVLAISAAGDERNPPEIGTIERAMRKLRTGRLYVIPASKETRGHGTTGFTRFWAPQLGEFLRTVPQRPMH